MERAVFRIIDANFNRAREGLRIAEEFCRFSLNNQSLSGRCKQIRHKLTAAVNKFDSQQLITARDTENDIGCGLEVSGQMKRTDFQDCLTAGFARTTEALRVLAEATAGLDKKAADNFEKLRYDCYTLEKDIAIFSSCSLRFAKVKLYVILTVENCPDVLATAKACAENGADCIQLRAKTISDADLFALAGDFVKICKNNNVVSIINDRIDIALCCDADGVHLGQDDLSPEHVRKCQLRPLITGISTHSLTELKNAVEQTPHYVGLGSVFTTNTKLDVRVAGLDYVSRATEFLEDKSVHAVAIGGINPDNVEKVLQAGARKIAVSSCVCGASNSANICKKLRQTIARYNPD